MAWTTPRTWVHGEFDTIAYLNEQIRDNMNALKSPPSDNYEANEASDYTTNSAVFVDIDATNLAMAITPSQDDATIIVGFHGSFIHDTPDLISIDIDIDGSRVAGDDGIVCIRPSAAGANGQKPVEFMRLITGLSSAAHTIKLQWKTVSGNATLYAGAGTAGGGDVHLQFWAREIS